MKKNLLTEDREALSEAKHGVQPRKVTSQAPIYPLNNSIQKTIPEFAASLQPTVKALNQECNVASAGFLRGKRIRRMIAVFMVLALGTFALKTIIDGFVSQTSLSDHKNTVISALTSKEKTAGKEFQNALVTVIVPPDTKTKQTFPKPEKIKDIKKQISLKGTDYTVGYFGGISGLKLTLSNHSKHFINRVELEVNYLKRNGEVIETDTYQVKYINAHSSQTLCIPPSRNGVKVKYKIMNIYAYQYPLLKEV